jgi:hypothetical protein
MTAIWRLAEENSGELNDVSLRWHRGKFKKSMTPKGSVTAAACQLAPRLVTFDCFQTLGLTARLNSAMNHVLTFKCEYINGGTALLMPCIDSVELADLVAAFERQSGYNDPAGGYGGIVPSHYELGPLAAYFLGEMGAIEGGQPGEIYALFCQCGEAGCWPLVTHVRADNQLVVWHDFSQPYRPQRDYSGFGPFTFERSEYERAVATASRFKDAS